MSRDIDRQIAELMGYEAIIHPNLTKTWVIHKHGEYEYQPLPRYSTSWEEMGLLVEWLQGKEIEPTIEFQKYGTHVNLGDELTMFIQGEWNKSAPLALCKAVLSIPSEVLQDA